MTLSARTFVRLELVHPELAARWMKVQAEMLSVHGRQLQVAQGVRTYQEQRDLYAQGRTKPGRKITNARAGQSWHNFGLAVDSVFEGADPYLERLPDRGEFLWSEYGRLGVKHGLDWGGDWERFQDRPHLELTLGIKLAMARALYDKNGQGAVWERVSRLMQV